MTTMAMTADERRRLEIVEDEVRENKKNIGTLEEKIDRILSLLKGLAWGIGVGIVLTLLLLGALTLKDILEHT